MVTTGLDVAFAGLVLAVWLATVVLLTSLAGLLAWSRTTPGPGEAAGRSRLRRRERTTVAAATVGGLLLPVPAGLLLGALPTAVAVAAAVFCVGLVAGLVVPTGRARTEGPAADPGGPLPRARWMRAVAAAAAASLVGAGLAALPRGAASLPATLEPGDVAVGLVGAAVLAGVGAGAARWSRDRPVVASGRAPQEAVVVSLRRRVRFRLLRAVSAGTALSAGSLLAPAAVGPTGTGPGPGGWADGVVGGVGVLLLLAGGAVLASRPPPLAVGTDAPPRARGEGDPPLPSPG